MTTALHMVRKDGDQDFVCAFNRGHEQIWGWVVPVRECLKHDGEEVLTTEFHGPEKLVDVLVTANQSIQQGER